MKNTFKEIENKYKKINYYRQKIKNQKKKKLQKIKTIIKHYTNIKKILQKIQIILHQKK